MGILPVNEADFVFCLRLLSQTILVFETFFFVLKGFHGGVCLNAFFFLMGFVFEGLEILGDGGCQKCFQSWPPFYFLKTRQDCRVTLPAFGLILSLLLKPNEQVRSTRAEADLSPYRKRPWKSWRCTWQGLPGISSVWGGSVFVFNDAWELNQLVRSPTPSSLLPSSRCSHRMGLFVGPLSLMEP